MIKVLTLIFLFSSAAFASDETPDPFKWYHRIKSHLPDRKIPRRFLYFKKNSGLWQVTPGPKDSLFAALPKEYFEFVKDRFETLAISTKKSAVNKIFDVMPVDALVFLSSKGASVRIKLKNGKVKKLKIKKKGKKVASVSWFIKKLGYDGMILDRKGDFLLVSTLKPQTSYGQALTLRNSHKKIRFSKKSNKGSALIQFIEGKGTISVFEILIKDEKSKSIVPGTKILLGNK